MSMGMSHVFSLSRSWCNVEPVSQNSSIGEISSIWFISILLMTTTTTTVAVVLVVVSPCDCMGWSTQLQLQPAIDFHHMQRGAHFQLLPVQRNRFEIYAETAAVTMAKPSRTYNQIPRAKFVKYEKRRRRWRRIRVGWSFQSDRNTALSSSVIVHCFSFSSSSASLTYPIPLFVTPNSFPLFPHRKNDKLASHKISTHNSILLHRSFIVAWLSQRERKRDSIYRAVTILLPSISLCAKSSFSSVRCAQ